MTDRRGFIVGAGGAFIIARSIAEGQPAAKVYQVGILLVASAKTVALLVHALTEGLRDLGYVEGRNVVFERRYADGIGSLPNLATELVRLRVDVIVTGSNMQLAAVQHATTTVPIVFVAVGDPVGSGFIPSLARPGGNITGLTSDATREIQAKNLAMLKEAVPRLSRVGLLGQVLSQDGFAALEAAAQQLNVALEVVDIRSPNDLEGAFATMVAKRVGAVIVGGGPLTYMRRQQIAELALTRHLPAIQVLNEFAQAGLLMSYGPNLPQMYRRAASYVDKILRGAKPGDLAVEQPTKFELVINLRTARALGLTIPQPLLLRADELIQ